MNLHTELFDVSGSLADQGGLVMWMMCTQLGNLLWEPALQRLLSRGFPQEGPAATHQHVTTDLSLLAALRFQPRLGANAGGGPRGPKPWLMVCVLSEAMGTQNALRDEV